LLKADLGLKMSDIIPFTTRKDSGDPDISLFQELAGGFKLVRLFGGKALERACASMKMGYADNEDNRRKADDDGYLTLVLQDAGEVGAMLLSVRMADGWIEQLLFSDLSDRLEALRAIAPVVVERNWRKHYSWSHGYLITAHGKVVSVNALPDVVSVNGNLEVFNYSQVRLPGTLTVVGDVILHTCDVTTPPRFLNALNVVVIGCTMPRVANRVKTEGNLSITMSRMAEIADAAVVKGDLEFSDMPNPISMPPVLRVGGTLKAEDDSIHTFGADSVVMGDLKLVSKRTASRFGLDFSGRIVRFGDRIGIVEVSDNGNPEAREMEGMFTGIFKNGKYTCQLLDPETGTNRSVSPLRYDILWKGRTVEPENLLANSVRSIPNF